VLIQPNVDRQYDYAEGAATHLSQPEGFVLIGGYLSLTWLLRLMPHAYYGFEGGINWAKVMGCLMLQDCLQYGMHRLEHKAHPKIYKESHEPHHRFTNPRLFDAFNGSLPDTLIMIVGPLYATANLIHCNVWTYMAFGSVYANWLCLIHSETHHFWDPLFDLLKFGTAADHHVHHKLFTSNYGHLFMYWDMACRTYKSPRNVRQFVPNGKPPRKWEGSAKHE
jgi:sterol desaturase/sphingolipid hydroxylase (fatty acid hydroxylase superfamily)